MCVCVCVCETTPSAIHMFSQICSPALGKEKKSVPNKLNKVIDKLTKVVLITVLFEAPSSM